ncbi:UNKNOWN [Stylonychia lemnae]|uniref:Uncharacterized protein n=1 Tax=Stylonychia lemnae TaxID=5949 RepID=A0A078B597_STYLE|nr:UNKNOWN [Stylonychia lemnae]|eukprot:CDW89599.1 UNKNOWN [Stylonychia lemnae]
MMTDNRVREQIKDGVHIKKNLMSFLYKFDQKLMKLQQELAEIHIRDENINQVQLQFQEIQENWNQIFQVKDLRSQLDQDNDYLKAIEKAIQVLQDDPLVNYEVLLHEQLKEFYLLQPEQASLSDNYFFLEKKQNTQQFDQLDSDKKLIQNKNEITRNDNRGNFTSNQKHEISFGGEINRLGEKQMQQHQESQERKYVSIRDRVQTQNPFRIRSESQDGEILPDKTEKQTSQDRQLKMTIPKSILKSSQELKENMNVPKHVNFDSNDSEADTFRDPNLQSQQFTDRSNLSDITQFNAQTQKILKKFLKGDWEIDHTGEDYLVDKILLEFPVFSLNEDYIRALINIVFSKIDQAQNMINQKNDQIQNYIKGKQIYESRRLKDETKRQRDDSLKILKGKTNDRSLERDTSQTKKSVAFKQTDKEKIDNWIQKQHKKQQLQQQTLILSSVLQQVIDQNLQGVFNQLLLHQSNLVQKQQEIEQSVAHKIRGKIFYRWFDAYYNNIESTYQIYYKTLKRKIFRYLILNKRQYLLKHSKALKLQQENLKFKGFLGFLQNLNLRRKEKEKRRQEIQKELEANQIQKPNLNLNLNAVFENVKPQKLVEILPIIDRDIANAYQKELSPKNMQVGSYPSTVQRDENSSPNHEQIIGQNDKNIQINQFNHNQSQSTLPIWYQTGQSNNTLLRGTNHSMSFQQPNNQSNNYSPVRVRQYDDSNTQASFNWRLTNNTQTRTINPFTQILSDEPDKENDNTNLNQDLRNYYPENQELQKQQQQPPRQPNELNNVFSFQNTLNIQNQKDYNTINQIKFQDQRLKQPRAISPYFDRQVQFFLGKGQPIQSHKTQNFLNHSSNRSLIPQQSTLKSNQSFHSKNTSNQKQKQTPKLNQLNSYNKYNQVRSPQNRQNSSSIQKGGHSITSPASSNQSQIQSFKSAVVRMTYKNNEKSVTRSDSEQRNPSYAKNTVSFISKHIDQ